MDYIYLYQKGDTMKPANFGHIFIYNNSNKKIPFLQSATDLNAYKIFQTGNIYQFLQYSKEIYPDVMILHLDNPNRQLAKIMENTDLSPLTADFPIIITKPLGQKFDLHQRVAHYVQLPLEVGKLNDIVESYCLGYKQHRILLLDAYSPQYDRLHRSLDVRGYSYFEVHNEKAAAIYLQKNNPQTVFIEYSPQFLTARHNLLHEHIFYVDRQQDITEIEKFLN